MLGPFPTQSAIVTVWPLSHHWLSVALGLEMSDWQPLWLMAHYKVLMGCHIGRAHPIYWWISGLALIRFNVTIYLSSKQCCVCSISEQLMLFFDSLSVRTSQSWNKQAVTWSIWRWQDFISGIRLEIMLIVPERKVLPTNFISIMFVSPKLCPKHYNFQLRVLRMDLEGWSLCSRYKWLSLKTTDPVYPVSAGKSSIDHT